MNPALIQRGAIGIRGKTSKKGLDEKGDRRGIRTPPPVNGFYATSLKVYALIVGAML